MSLMTSYTATKRYTDKTAQLLYQAKILPPAQFFASTATPSACRQLLLIRCLLHCILQNGRGNFYSLAARWTVHAKSNSWGGGGRGGGLNALIIFDVCSPGRSCSAQAVAEQLWSDCSSIPPGARPDLQQ